MRQHVARARPALSAPAAVLVALVALGSAGSAQAAKPRCFGLAATIVGTNGANVIRGTSGSDVIVARGGNDRVLGRGGNDRICLGAGNGHAGFDLVQGGPGGDRLDGGADTDTLSFATSKAGVTANLTAGLSFGGATGEGDDKVRGFEVVVGSSRADTLNGTASGDFLVGGGGNDHLWGFGGSDFLTGQGGHDELHSGSGDLDQLEGGPGNDFYDGAGGGPTAIFAGAAGPVVVDLGAGTASGEGADTLAGVTGVFGSSFADTLTGSDAGVILIGLDGDDTLTGGAGIDVVEGGDGSDSIDGGANLDATSYFSSFNPILGDLAAGEVDGQGKDTLLGVESIAGSDLDDDIRGDGGPLNVLFGEFGDDFLDGRGGFDLVFGGAGTDECLNWENDPGEPTQWPNECELPVSGLQRLAQAAVEAEVDEAIELLEKAERLLGGAR
jgi:Ca2+-binding RTX toxin-like protein